MTISLCHHWWWLIRIGKMLNFHILTVFLRVIIKKFDKTCPMSISPYWSMLSQCYVELNQNMINHNRSIIPIGLEMYLFDPKRSLWLPNTLATLHYIAWKLDPSSQSQWPLRPPDASFLAPLWTRTKMHLPCPCCCCCCSDILFSWACTVTNWCLA